ncbi:hypothetical protein D9758_009467 [Tetrapyrgos nigripes]|uniref:Uracil-DNA glycosylase-like domain-containing protein n=1 Tax=Tetrapyrgos nigripes TaxID=182062 RepID=A0A8H5LGC3_9AGAR|nr:hypothetical protein D9758_009467 [Tetrapyrgos nigripes]
MASSSTSFGGYSRAGPEKQDEEEMGEIPGADLQGFRASLSKFTYRDARSQSLRNVQLSKKRSRSSSPPYRPSQQPSSPKKQKSRGYASPEKYAHLHHINDHLALGLDIVFCGINPGQRSAEMGHHFAHPTNHFWKCLHLSGLTPTQLSPTEDFTLPERFSYGLTNIVDRPTAEASELKDSELTAGVPTFLQKIERYRPRIVCFIGLNIGRSVLKYASRQAERHDTKQWNTFSPGLQPYKMVYKTENGGIDELPAETFFYALPSTSGKVQGYQIPDKTLLFVKLKNDLTELKEGTFTPAVPFSVLTL